MGVTIKYKYRDDGRGRRDVNWDVEWEGEKLRGKYVMERCGSGSE